MTQGVYRNTAGQIKVFTAFGVPNVTALGMIGNDRCKSKIRG